MGKVDNMAERLKEKYATNPLSEIDLTEQEEELSYYTSPERIARWKGQQVPVHTGKRGRPRGSKTRKEEVTRVGFECEVQLLKDFERTASAKGLGKREAFHAALRCFIQSK